jgi:Na+/melibiose symporter-like transporter
MLFFLPNLKHFQEGAILAVVCIPVILSIVAAQLEDFINPRGWRQGLVEAGWDLCVLALGIMGAVICEHPKPTGVLAGVGSIGLILIITLIIGRFRLRQRYTGYHAVTSFMLSAIAILIPTAWITKYVTEACK